jgi:uncharacterized protein YjbI with pentapeptide repeats
MASRSGFTSAGLPSKLTPAILGVGNMANPEHVAILATGVEPWNRWRKENPKLSPDLSAIDFTSMSAFAGLRMKMEGAVQASGVNEVINLVGVDFSQTDLSGSNLKYVLLTDANLSGAKFWQANLEGAWLSGASIVDANFFRAVLKDVAVRRIKYRRSRLSGNFLGVRGAETLHGDGEFRRDVLDQEYIDTKRWRYKQPWWNPARIFALWPWAFFDYGRNWLRVVLLALLLISLFGLGYAHSNGIHIRFEHAGPTVSGSFYPWFVASMGFATLGISDMIEPLDGWGQALMIGNVLSGFVTLGLLLSVLGNSFARRA